MLAVAKFILATIDASNAQTACHTTDPDNKEETIGSPFFFTIEKNTWRTELLVKMRSAASESDGSVTYYLANSSLHFLCYSYLRQKFPALSVKPEYRSKIRICWPHNLGTTIVTDATTRAGDDVIASLDRTVLDNNAQWYIKAGHREKYREMVGNVPIMEDWQINLPSYTTNIEQPWWYCRNSSMALPLFLVPKGNKSDLTHVYNCKNSITDLLRMGEKDSKTGQIIPIECKLEYLDGVPTDGLLKPPEMYGRYAYVTDDEIKHHTCRDETRYLIEDYVVCDSDNPIPSGKNSTVTLSCSTPCKVIFWSAENSQGLDFNNYSNYSTDPYSVYSGWDPIKLTTIELGAGTKLIDKMESDHFSASEARNFPSAPTEPGYHALAMSHCTTGVQYDVGIILSALKAKILMLLSSSVPFTRLTDNKTTEVKGNEDFSDDEKQISTKGKTTASSVSKVTSVNTYIPRVRLLVMRQLLFKKGSDGEYTIHIDPEK